MKRPGAIYTREGARTRAVAIHPDELALFAAYASAILLLIGLFVPSFTMIPKLGDGFGEQIARMVVTDHLEPRSFSVAGGILHLYGEHEWFIASLLLTFSVLFPLLKLVVTFFLLHANVRQFSWVRTVLAHLGKWSMLDVFVIAALVISFKQFPGGSRVEIEWGAYVFAASVLLNMTATAFSKSRR